MSSTQLLSKNERTMPKWVTEANQRVGPKPPPPPIYGITTNTTNGAVPKAPTVPPKKNEPEPDYEVIEFTGQQYSNEPLKTTVVRTKTPDNKLKCTLCGSNNPWVTCAECAGQIFCASCDDMFHKHPKRKQHVRKAVELGTPPIPPKQAPGQAGGTPPVAPPRRSKRGLLTPFMQRKEQLDVGHLPPPSPAPSMKHSSHSGSWPDGSGSLKRGTHISMNNRPLPETPPKTPSEGGHSSRSTTPKSVFDNIQRPPSVQLEKIKSKASATLDRMAILQQRYRQQKAEQERERSGSITDQRLPAFDHWSNISPSPTHFRSGSMSSGLNSSHFDLTDDTATTTTTATQHFNTLLFQRQQAQRQQQQQLQMQQHQQQLQQRNGGLAGQRNMSTSVFNLNTTPQRHPTTTADMSNGWLQQQRLQQAQSMAQLNCSSCQSQQAQHAWQHAHAHAPSHPHGLHPDDWSQQFGSQQQFNHSNLSLNVGPGYMPQQQTGPYPPPVFMTQRGMLPHMYPYNYTGGMPIMHPGIVGMPPMSASRTASRAGSRFGSPAMSRKSVTLRRKRSNYVDDELTDDEDSDQADNRSMISTRSGMTSASRASLHHHHHHQAHQQPQPRQRRLSSASQLLNDEEGEHSYHRRHKLRDRRGSIAKSVQSEWLPDRQEAGTLRRNESGFSTPVKPSRIYSDLESEGSGTRALVQAKIQQKVDEERAKQKQTKKTKQKPYVEKKSTEVQAGHVVQAVKQHATPTTKPIEVHEDQAESVQSDDDAAEEDISEEALKMPAQVAAEAEASAANHVAANGTTMNGIEIDGDADSLGPPPTTPDHEWECEFCTFVNEPNIKICAICCKTPSRAPAKPKTAEPPKEVEVAEEEIHDIPTVVEEIKVQPKTSTAAKPKQTTTRTAATKSVTTATATAATATATQKPITKSRIASANTNTKTATATTSTATSAKRTQSSATVTAPMSKLKLSSSECESDKSSFAKGFAQKDSVENIWTTLDESIQAQADQVIRQAQKVSTACGSSPVREVHAVSPPMKKEQRQAREMGTSPPPQSISTQTYDTLPYASEKTLEQSPSNQQQERYKTPEPVKADHMSPYYRSFSQTPQDNNDRYRSTNDLRYPDGYGMDYMAANAATRRPTLINELKSLQNLQQASPFGLPETLSYEHKLARDPETELQIILKELELYKFTVEELQAALKYCGTDTHPIQWLRENWHKLVQTVQSLATKYGQERAENTIGTISQSEAREALRCSGGNVWQAVSDCIEQRQRKFRELHNKGNYLREDIVNALTAHQGNIEQALLELNRTQLKPFLMRIWGSPGGVENESGISGGGTTVLPPDPSPSQFKSDIHDFLSTHALDCLQTSSMIGINEYSAANLTQFDNYDSRNNNMLTPLDNPYKSTYNTPSPYQLEDSTLKNLEILIGNMEQNQAKQNQEVLSSIESMLHQFKGRNEVDFDDPEVMRIMTKSPIRASISQQQNSIEENTKSVADVKNFVWQHIQEIVPNLVQQVEQELMERPKESQFRSDRSEEVRATNLVQIVPQREPTPVDPEVYIMEEVIKPNLQQASIKEELPPNFIYATEIANFKLEFDRSSSSVYESEWDLTTLENAERITYKMCTAPESKTVCKIEKQTPETNAELVEEAIVKIDPGKVEKQEEQYESTIKEPHTDSIEIQNATSTVASALVEKTNATAVISEEIDNASTNIKEPSEKLSVIENQTVKKSEDANTEAISRVNSEKQKEQTAQAIIVKGKQEIPSIEKTSLRERDSAEDEAVKSTEIEAKEVIENKAEDLDSIPSTSNEAKRRNKRSLLPRNEQKHGRSPRGRRHRRITELDAKETSQNYSNVNETVNEPEAQTKSTSDSIFSHPPALEETQQATKAAFENEAITVPTIVSATEVSQEVSSQVANRENAARDKTELQIQQSENIEMDKTSATEPAAIVNEENEKDILSAKAQVAAHDVVDNAEAAATTLIEEVVNDKELQELTIDAVDAMTEDIKSQDMSYPENSQDIPIEITNDNQPTEQGSPKRTSRIPVRKTLNTNNSSSDSRASPHSSAITEEYSLEVSTIAQNTEDTSAELSKNETTEEIVENIVQVDAVSTEEAPREITEDELKMTTDEQEPTHQDSKVSGEASNSTEEANSEDFAQDSMVLPDQTFTEIREEEVKHIIVPQETVQEEIEVSVEELHTTVAAVTENSIENNMPTSGEESLENAEAEIKSTSIEQKSNHRDSETNIEEHADTIESEEVFQDASEFSDKDGDEDEDEDEIMSAAELDDDQSDAELYSVASNDAASLNDDVDNVEELREEARSPTSASEVLLLIKNDEASNVNGSNTTISSHSSQETTRSKMVLKEFVPSGDPAKQNLSELVEDTQRLIKQMREEISMDEFESTDDEEYTDDDEDTDEYDVGEEEEWYDSDGEEEGDYEQGDEYEYDQTPVIEEESSGAEDDDLDDTTMDETLTLTKVEIADTPTNDTEAFINIKHESEIIHAQHSSLDQPLSDQGQHSITENLSFTAATKSVNISANVSEEQELVEQNASAAENNLPTEAVDSPKETQKNQNETDITDSNNGTQALPIEEVWQTDLPEETQADNANAMESSTISVDTVIENTANTPEELEAESAAVTGMPISAPSNITDSESRPTELPTEIVLQKPKTVKAKMNKTGAIPKTKGTNKNTVKTQKLDDESPSASKATSQVVKQTTTTEAKPSPTTTSKPIEPATTKPKSTVSKIPKPTDSAKKISTRSKSFSGPSPIGISSVRAIQQEFLQKQSQLNAPSRVPTKTTTPAVRRNSITEAISKLTRPAKNNPKEEAPAASGATLFRSRTQPRIPKKKYHETCFSDDYESSTEEEPEPEPLELRTRKLSMPVFRAYPSVQEVEIEEPAVLARKYVEQDLVANIAEAHVAATLVCMKFQEDVSIWAAKECSDLDQAIAMLQQECELCMSTYPMNQIVSLLKCTHKCCKQCAKSYFTVQITDRSINDCNCPFCKIPELANIHDHEDEHLEYFSNLDILLKNILDSDVHELFQRKLRDRTLLQDPNFKWCIQCSSGFFARPKQKRLICPDCGSVTCAQCRKPWGLEHEGTSCEAYDEWRRQNDPEIQAQGVQEHLALNGIDCPKCKFKYSLARGGCMHFTCSQCKFEFCYGCARPFMMGAKCNVSPYCAKLGLHAHHPRNCLFYLRDKIPLQLQFLLKENKVSFDVEPVTATDELSSSKAARASSRCPIPLQKETPQGLVDTVCSTEVPDKHAGMCRTHYVEYLSAKVAKAGIDPLPIFDLTDCVQELRRRGIALPERGPWDTDEIYKNMCAEVIKKNIPLKST